MPADILPFRAQIASPASPMDGVIRPLLLMWQARLPHMDDDEANFYKDGLYKAMGDLQALFRSGDL
jgi:hypothetical protein